MLLRKRKRISFKEGSSSAAQVLVAKRARSTVLVSGFHKITSKGACLLHFSYLANAPVSEVTGSLPSELKEFFLLPIINYSIRRVKQELLTLKEDMKVVIDGRSRARERVHRYKEELENARRQEKELNRRNAETEQYNLRVAEGVSSQLKEYDEEAQKAMRERDEAKDTEEASKNKNVVLERRVVELEKAYKEKKSEVDAWRKTVELADEAAEEAKKELQLCDIQRADALAWVEKLTNELTTKGDLEMKLNVAEEENRVVALEKLELSNEVSSLKAEKADKIIEFKKELKIVGSKAVAELKLELFQQFKEGNTSGWRVDEEIATCEMVLSLADQRQGLLDGDDEEEEEEAEHEEENENDENEEDVEGDFTEGEGKPGNVVLIRGEDPLLAIILILHRRRQA